VLKSAVTPNNHNNIKLKKGAETKRETSLLDPSFMVN